MKTLCLVAALGLALSCAAARAAELKAGDPAPEFSLRRLRRQDPHALGVPRQAGGRPGLVSRRRSPVAERRSASRSVRAAS